MVGLYLVCIICVVLVVGMGVFYSLLLRSELEKQRRFLNDLSQNAYSAILAKSPKELVDAEVGKKAAMVQLDLLEKSVQESAKEKVQAAPAAFFVTTEDGQKINMNENKWEYV